MPSDAMEYLKIGFSFAGALLGAFIGTPLIEWFKDALGARRQWKTQRNEIVVTIRLILGMLEAFKELEQEAFGFLLFDTLPPYNLNYSPSGFARVSKFDFKLFDDCLVKLSGLHPVDSGRSAVGQRLIQHLVVVESYLKQIQQMTPVQFIDYPDGMKCLGLSEEDQRILYDSNEKFTAFMRLLIHLYSKRIGISGMSLLDDAEITKAEQDFRQYDMDRLAKKFEQSTAALRQTQPPPNVGAG